MRVSSGRFLNVGTLRTIKIKAIKNKKKNKTAVGASNKQQQQHREGSSTRAI
jgi:hypothetical protein